jgi:HEAT repeat protein
VKELILLRLAALSVFACAVSVSCSKTQTKTDSSQPIHKGKPLKEWAVMAQGQNPDLSPSPAALESIEAVRTIGTNGIPFLIKWLEPPWDSSVEPGGAVEAFKILGPTAKSAIPQLARLLDKYKPPHSMDGYSGWHNAVEALSYLGSDALPVLLQAATNIQGQHIQWELIQNLGNFGSNGAPAIPALIAWCSDNDAWVRLGAVNALGQIGQRPELVMPVLLAALKDPDPLVRRDAAEALAAFSKDAKTVVQDLIKALDDRDWQTRTGAIAGLGRIGEQPEIVVPLLMKQLRDQNRIIRRVAAFALGDIGGKDAFDSLMTATDDPDDFVREAVFQSLKKIDPQALEKSGKKFY